MLYFSRYSESWWECSRCSCCYGSHPKCDRALLHWNWWGCLLFVLWCQKEEGWVCEWKVHVYISYHNCTCNVIPSLGDPVILDKHDKLKACLSWDDIITMYILILLWSHRHIYYRYMLKYKCSSQVNYIQFACNSNSWLSMHHLPCARVFLPNFWKSWPQGNLMLGWGLNSITCNYNLEHEFFKINYITL